MIYLDYSATTPMSEEALETFVSASKHYFGNERSLHDVGSNASLLLETCRKQLASFLNASPASIYFTSGGTESNILGLQTLLKSTKKPGRHILTTTLEHSSISNYVKVLEEQGFEVTYIPVNQNGIVSVDLIKKAIRDDTILGIFQHVNSEIGAIQPIKDIAKLFKPFNIMLHCDCVQSFGKLDINLAEFDVSSISISSHKLYGPKGVGALYINPKLTSQPIYPGTSHESGIRPGTVNVPAIASFVTAVGHIINSKDHNQQRYLSLRQLFRYELKDVEKLVRFEGSDDDCIPNIIGMRIIGLEGQFVMLECNRHQFAISTGSACAIGMQKPSETMLAIGRSEHEAKQFFRISIGKYTNEEDLTKLASTLKLIMKQNLLTEELKK
ncbi:IscS subfamily cysteine desulfurase [Gottfriedia solisilvae]|uniref:Cysteine desulfurase n=1 Tax=Gottfriedia solisilvae TaxID=1516104 RepID=A0A8J3EWK7_9BACI|nr:IscS subfamily cysteine desulfurase [Gottfriedia solisilvae]GGI10518.1 cysteine desulfurase [Gottfriedia solisilvae]